MILNPFRSLPLALAAAAAILLSACDRGVTGPAEEELVVREMILQQGATDFIFSHADHWHGAPVVREGETATLTMHFTSIRMAPDDHDMPPIEQWFTLAGHPDHNVRVVIQDTTLARWSGDRTNGTLQGLRPGASVISFVVRRGTTTIYEAPPLNFRVQAR